MKFKSILIASLALLVSCETSHIDNSYTSSEDVSFLVTQDSGTTKGTPIDRAKELTNIGVFAALTNGPYADAVTTPEPTFMSNQRVDRIDNKWVYNPPLKWSTAPDDLVSFFAYAPFATPDNGITIAPNSGTMPTLRYQVPQTNSHHPDLMVAVPAYNRVGRQGAVGLKFRHALAAISFSVKGDPSRVIAGVSLKGVTPAATLSLVDSDIAWSDPAERTTQSYDLGLIENVTAPEDGDTAASITALDGYLMMIPQDITDVAIEVLLDGETTPLLLNFEPGSKWVAGARYNYIIDLKAETIRYDISQTSNCYIVKNTDIKELYIPIDQRINAFWYGYSGLCEADSEKYLIDSKTKWKTEILWCDNPELAPITATRYNGVVPDDSTTTKSYVCDDTEAVMKVTLPANRAIGNILISVIKRVDKVDVTLWSWHLWVTDYDPDSEITTTSKPTRFNVTNGQLHRYVNDDPDFWTEGLYANTYTMDRDLGSHDNLSADGLFYQWGRKDPFSTTVTWSTENVFATFATAVQNPKIFYAKSLQWCDEPTDGAYGLNDYLWYDTTKLNPLIHTNIKTLEKSIFDPSPLGWCVPLSEAYTKWGDRHNYNNIVYFCMSGHIYPVNGKIRDETETTSLWCADRATNGKGYYPYITKTTFGVDVITTAYGHRIRPVKMPR